MKIMKLTCSLAFALAVALAATGCKNHKPVGVTPLPGTTRASQIGEQGPGGTMGAGGTIGTLQCAGSVGPCGKVRSRRPYLTRPALDAQGTRR